MPLEKRHEINGVWLDRNPLFSFQRSKKTNQLISTAWKLQSRKTTLLIYQPALMCQELFLIFFYNAVPTQPVTKPGIFICAQFVCQEKNKTILLPAADESASCQNAKPARLHRTHLHR